MCQWHASRREARARQNNGGCDGKTADVPVTSTPALIRSPSALYFPDDARTGGGLHKGSAYGDGVGGLLASQDIGKIPTGAMVHNVVPSQEAGYNMHVIGRAAGSNFSVLRGSITPVGRSRASVKKHTICTSSHDASRSVACKLGRPNCADLRSKLPGATRV